MTVGIVGSRSIFLPIPEGVIPENTSRIISGGAAGIDRSARQYAKKHGILIEEILPAYDLYGKRAPLVRNDIIIERSDAVFVFWDGESHGSAYVIRECKKHNKYCKIYILNKGRFEEYEQ